jgi:hypothetical protein
MGGKASIGGTIFLLTTTYAAVRNGLTHNDQRLLRQLL